MKIAYLTIDDCPSRDFRSKIDFLVKKNISAILFCQGGLLEERPDDAIYAISRGFLIGNHTYSHPHFSDCTLKKCLDEITKTDEIINNLYTKSDTKRPVKFFRFSYGDKGDLRHGSLKKPLIAEGAERKNLIQKHLKNLGYTKPAFPRITYKWYSKYGLDNDLDWYWTYNCMEYAIYGKQKYGIDNLEKVLARMDEDVPEGHRGLNYKGSEDIVLVHDHEKTTDIFEPIINKLLTKVKFKSVGL